MYYERDLSSLTPARGTKTQKHKAGHVRSLGASPLDPPKEKDSIETPEDN
jgi:hypothetical protein